MQNTFRRAADVYKTARKVIDKIKESKIKPYNGEDAYYSGTDEDYEEFLKDMESGAADDCEAAAAAEENPAPEETRAPEENPAENTVADDFSEEPEENGEDTEQTDDDGTKRAPSWQELIKDITKRRRPGEDAVEDEKLDGIMTAVEELKSAVDGLKTEGNGVKETAACVERAEKAVETLSAQMSKINVDISGRLSQVSEIMLDIKAQNSQNRARVEAISDAAGRIERICTEIAGTTSAMDKLNDNVFELKKAQLETRRTLADEMDIIDSVRKRFTVGITILCILTAVSIILQVVNFLY